MMGTTNPLDDFKKKLLSFARGEKRGIRNPFVIVPMDPHLEPHVADNLVEWKENTTTSDLPIHVIHLDRHLPTTQVFRVAVSVPPGAVGSAAVQAESIQKTLEENLSTELVKKICGISGLDTQQKKQVVLLLNLGSLHPFARASEILDELDRVGVRSTIGLPFPGKVIGGKLSFFGEDARHYYPAHRIPGQIKGAHLP